MLNKIKEMAIKKLEKQGLQIMVDQFEIKDHETYEFYLNVAKDALSKIPENLFFDICVDGALNLFLQGLSEAASEKIKTSVTAKKITDTLN